jgi:large subunit ribosomal protein LP0
MASKKSRERKYVLAEELEQHFDNYSRLFMVTVDNVGSNQLHEIRKNLRGKALIYCGKNTQIRRVLRKLEEAGRPELEQIRQKCKLNIALVFTNESLSDIKTLIEENKMPAAAKAGAIAQVDVVIEKGITSLEPSMTSFLQALNIGTKITKGAIEIINDVHLLHAGLKVDASQAALLQKMDMFPFAYGLVVQYVYDNGSLFEPSVLDITDAQIMGSFQFGVKQVAALSIMTGQPTLVSVPYSILLAFRNLLAVSVATEYEFEGSKKVKAYLADPSAFVVEAGPAAAASGGAKTAAAAVEEEEEEEEEMAAGGGLFGEEADDY